MHADEKFNAEIGTCSGEQQVLAIENLRNAFATANNVFQGGRCVMNISR